MEQTNTMTADTSPDSTESTPPSISDCVEHQKSSMPLISQENQSDIVPSQQKDHAILTNGIFNGEKTPGLFSYEGTNGCVWGIRGAGSINPHPPPQHKLGLIGPVSHTPSTLCFCLMRKFFVELISITSITLFMH